jgi:hypothetical protein
MLKFLLSCFLVCLAVAGSSRAQTIDDSNIQFREKTFVDDKQDNFILVSGTLVADWLAYPNNTYTISCDRTTCIVGSIDQFGKNQVGRIDVGLFNVELWSNNAVTAVDDEWCMRRTINIDRTNQTVLVVDVPINQGTTACIQFQPIKPRTATIETPQWAKH